MLKSMLRKLVNIYADNTTMAADLSSDLLLTAQWTKTFPVTFNISNKLVSFYPHEASSEFFQS